MTSPSTTDIHDKGIDIVQKWFQGIFRQANLQASQRRKARRAALQAEVLEQRVLLSGINEIRIDQSGINNDDYFELAGTEGESLDGLSYIVIGSSTDDGSGVIKSVIDLSGQTIPPDGFFLVAEDTFTLSTADLTAALNFENGDNVTHLLVEGFTGAVDDDLDADDDGMLDVMPWTAIVDSVAIIENPNGGDQVYSQLTVGPDGTDAPGHVFRDPDVAGLFQIGILDAADANADDTPGMENTVAPSAPAPTLETKFSRVGGLGDPLTGAEITAFDPNTNQLFVTSGDGLQVIDLSDPTNPTVTTTFDPTDAGLSSSEVTHVAIRADGLVAIAVPADPATDPGTVLFLDPTLFATDPVVGQVTVGSLPDMVTFTPDGMTVLTANEGEPDDNTDPNPTIDPPGSVSIIDLSNGPENATVQTADFTAFDGLEDDLRDAGVRIFPGRSASNDLEPEYISVSPDGSTAFVTLQEANAFAIVDIANATITDVVPLGRKDFSQDLPLNLMDVSNTLDASNDDDAFNLENWPVFGLYMPDGIASFTGPGGETLYITANEGDSRDFDESDVSDVDLDDTVFSNEAALQEEENLGNLQLSNIDGDTDGDGDFDEIVSYGARSFSMWDENGELVYDSGDTLARIADAAGLYPDGRSDNKGTEPEGVTIGNIDGQTYAFIGLERAESVAVFNVTDPTDVTFTQLLHTPGDSEPEGLTFISAADSPNGEPLLVVANEDSTTISVYSAAPQSFTLELLHVTDQEAATGAIQDAPRLSAVLNALRDQDLGNDGLPDNTLTLSSGDAFIPGVFFDASEAVFGSGGIADIQIQNELGFQAIALGNHEFDKGPEILAGLIDGSANGMILDSDFTGAKFPYLSSNLDFSTEPALADLAVPGGQAPQPGSVTSSVLLSVNSEPIGVVGATTPTLDTISSPGGVGISPIMFDGTPTPEQLDELAAVIQAEVDALLSASPGLNKIILLAHMQQIDIELALAERLTDVDIIVAGGSNTRLFDDNDRPRDGDSDQGEYPTFVMNPNSEPVAVVNTDGSYKFVGRLVIEFDGNGVIVPGSYDETVSGAYATDEQGVMDLNAAGLVDPEVQQIVDLIEAQIIATESNVFGISDVFLNGNRSGVDDGTDPDGVRTQETNLGNLTADANLAAGQAADSTVVVSIKNGGGIRASVGQTVVLPGSTEAVRLANEEIVDGDGNVIKPAGGISQNDIATTLAFNNALTLLTLTRTELVAVLEHGVGAVPAVSGRFPQIAGVNFSYDATLPEGERIQNAGIFADDGSLIAELMRDGEISGDPNETFRIITLSFLADGGDGYPFPTGPATNRVDLEQENVQTGDAVFADDGTEQDALAEYLNDNFMTTPFGETDTGRAEDVRIQNLAFREDTVFDDDSTPEEIAPVVDEFVAPTSVNGDFEQVQAGDFDGNGVAGDLFFWNPQTGRNRLITSDGTQFDDVVNPLAINGSMFESFVVGNFDDGGVDDLFFWDPQSGTNRIAHMSFDDVTPQAMTEIETNVIGQQWINGRDFTQVVAGDLDGAGPDDLFFWNSATGQNRLAHLETATAGTDTDLNNVQEDTVPATSINGNQFEGVVIGNFSPMGVDELLFLNTTTGDSRLVNLSVDMAGVSTSFVGIEPNVIPPTLINGGTHPGFTVTDFNDDGLDDVFFWDPVSGANRLAVFDELFENVQVLEDQIDRTSVNGDFGTVVSQAAGRSGDATGGLFFWNPESGLNRQSFTAPMT